MSKVSFFITFNRTNMHANLHRSRDVAFYENSRWRPPPCRIITEIIVSGRNGLELQYICKPNVVPINIFSRLGLSFFAKWRPPPSMILKMAYLNIFKLKKGHFNFNFNFHAKCRYHSEDIQDGSRRHVECRRK